MRLQFLLVKGKNKPGRAIRASCSRFCDGKHEHTVRSSGMHSGGWPSPQVAAAVAHSAAGNVISWRPEERWAPANSIH